ncbi:hypothetical protein ABID59_006267 [Bradyrhizobium sp. S3.3.6]|uniref:hypothetical protein n=1 Tax=Bradyrhizobium sp. S3.3.6 TaxID=3156429 RepID=UPI0033975955
MEFGNRIIVTGLRAIIRLAWGLDRAARATAAFGERLEGWAERQATQWQVDIDAVLMALSPEHKG